MRTCPKCDGMIFEEDVIPGLQEDSINRFDGAITMYSCINCGLKMDEQWIKNRVSMIKKARITK